MIRITRKLKQPNLTGNYIVDNEIRNNIVEDGDWKYEKADIICCGIYGVDEIEILFREKEDDVEDYKKELIKLLDKYKDNLYAFNKSMENGNFKGFLNKDYQVKEIKAFNGKGWNKQKFFVELLSDNKIPLIKMPIDPLEDDSGLCITYYEKEDYMKIIIHNLADLFKQYYILINKEYLRDKYKDILDENYWVKKQYK
jgi:hypothetical protein